MAPPGTDTTRKEASSATAASQKAARDTLNFADTRDFELAARGLIARDEQLLIEGPGDGPLGDIPAWDMTRYDFIDGEAPSTVHPGLWRQARLNNLHGLYEVTDGIYQVRGYDLSNISFIRGDSGWIVIDPLISAEPARAGPGFHQPRAWRATGNGGDLHPQPRGPLWRCARRRGRRGRRK